MVTQIQPVTAETIVYPDSDGQPMADNTQQFEWIVFLKKNLDVLFAEDPNVFVAGDLLWYPLQGRNERRTAPDVMVVFGRPKGDRGSYKQWEEDNIAPQVVFEILSPSNTLDEMARKLLFYERYGVEEYYIYDPATNQLSAWLRGEEGLDLVEFDRGWTSPKLQIRFELSDAAMQVFDPQGQPFRSSIEMVTQLEQTHHQLEQTQQQLAQERHRSQLLADKLRDLGIDPETL